MRHAPKTVLAAVAALALPMAGAVLAESTFDETKALAAREGKPLLVDFFTEW